MNKLRKRDIPNLISTFRMLTVPFLVWMILSKRMMFTFALFAFAFLTDYLDGFLARKYGWITELGKVLDPAADKLLMASLFISRLAVIPFEGWWWWTPWLFVPLLIEESLLAFGGFIAYRIKEERGKLGSNIYGKLKFTGEGLLGFLLLIFPDSAYTRAWIIILLTVILFVITLLSLKSIIGHVRDWQTLN